MNCYNSLYRISIDISAVTVMLNMCLTFPSPLNLSSQSMKVVYCAKNLSILSTDKNYGRETKG